MKFRYFILSGDSKNKYLNAEKKNMDELQHIHEELFDKRNDIEQAYQNYSGSVIGIIFKEGKKPEGFVPLDKNRFKENVVRPHKSDKKIQEIRDWFNSLIVKENCQEYILKELNLPRYVSGRKEGRLYMFNSRVGHVGEFVIVEVPFQENQEMPEDLDGNKINSYNEKYINQDFKEIQYWEFAKLFEDNKDYKYDVTVFKMAVKD